MFPLGYVADGDWNTVRRNTDATAQRLNPVLPQARVYNNANISIANATVTALTFNTERFNNGDVHSTSVNTGRLTAPITGLYLIGCHVAWDNASATGVRQTRLRANGTTVIAERTDPGSTAVLIEHALTTVYQMAAGEYVDVAVQQTSGGAYNVLSAASYSPEFWMVRLGGYTNMGVS